MDNTWTGQIFDGAGLRLATMGRSRAMWWSIVGLLAIAVAIAVAVAVAVMIVVRSDSDDAGDGSDTAATAEPGVQQHQLYVLGDSFSIAATPWYRTTDDELHGTGIETEFTADAAEGTGYLTGTSFIDRVIAGAPAETELTIVFGGNDELDRSPDELYDAAVALFAQLYTSAPHTGIVVVGPVWPGADAPDGVLAVRDALQRAATDASAIFYDPIVEQWFTGDDADLFDTDAGRPTEDGQAYMGVLLEPEIRQFFSA